MVAKIANVKLLLVALLGLAGCSNEVSFSGKVLPLLHKECGKCHMPGGDGYEASGFSVENYETVMKGTRFAAVIVPGSSVSSTLVVLLEHRANPAINMPRGGAGGKAGHIGLEKIDLVKLWIDQGARNN